MTILLKMARAFYERCPTEFDIVLNGSAYHSTIRKPWDALTAGERATVCAAIKAALEEVREPNEAMALHGSIAAAMAECPSRVTVAQAKACWAAAIDAILAEQGEKP